MSCTVQVNASVCRGADLIIELQTGLDLTGYDDLRAEFRSGVDGPTGVLEGDCAVSPSHVIILGDPSLGVVEVFLDHDQTYAFTAAAGWWSCQGEDTGTDGSRKMFAKGSYSLTESTIVTP